MDKLFKWGLQFCIGLECSEDPMTILWMVLTCMVSSSLFQNGCMPVKSLVWEIANTGLTFNIWYLGYQRMLVVSPISWISCPFILWMLVFKIYIWGLCKLKLGLQPTIDTLQVEAGYMRDQYMSRTQLSTLAKLFFCWSHMAYLGREKFQGLWSEGKQQNSELCYAQSWNPNSDSGMSVAATN